MRVSSRTSLSAALVAASLVGGCTSLSPEQSFSDVATTVSARSGHRVAWDPDGRDAGSVDETVRRLLSTPLTSRTAVQIALLNNRKLRATYADLGIAQADLFQAGRLPNPIVDGAITFSEDGATNLAFGAAMKLVRVLQIPRRKQVARSALEEAKFGVAIQILDVAGQTHRAFIDYQARQQVASILREVVRSNRASVQAAKSLRQAGNITALEFSQQQALLTQAKLDLASAQSQGAGSRETLNVLMGLYGPATEWRGGSKLHNLPSKERSTQRAERRAIEASFELAAARQKLITLAKRYRLTNLERLVPDIEAGAEWERDDGEKEAGPIFEVEVPLFDRGRARKATALMEIMRARDEFTALAIRIRSTARRTRAELLTARKTVGFYRQTVLPQAQSLVLETLRQVNAGQVGVFRLIQAKRRQIQARQRYIEALAAYWVAKARFSQLMKGKLPSGTVSASIRVADAGPSDEIGGH